MTWQEAYNTELIRAFFLMRGVPRDYADLPPKTRAVAESLIEEFGDAAFIGLGRRVDIVLQSSLVALLLSLSTRFTGTLTAQSVDAALPNVRADFARFSLQVETLGASAENQAIQIAKQAHVQGITKAAEIANRQAVVQEAIQGFADFRNEVRARAAVQMGFTDGIKPIVRAHVKMSMESVIKFIQTKIGKEADELLSELILQIAKNDELGSAVMRGMGPRRAAMGRAIGIARAALQPKTAHGLLPGNLRRNLIHSINGMHHEAKVLWYIKSPMVGLTRFSVSAAHPARESSPDACDIVARANPTGKGPGLYYVKKSPSLVHPFCQCNIEPVYRKPSEWGKPKEDGELNSVSFLDAASILDEMDTKVVAKHRDLANRRIQGSRTKKRAA